MNNFDDALDRLEAAPLAIATKFGPWITPMVPAFFVHRAMVEHLDAPQLWAWIAAIALEVVGVAATNSLLRAYQWEQERLKSHPAAPLWWNVVACVVYYSTAFLLVFLIELFPQAAAVAPAAFVILSGTSALVLALVGDQKRRERLVSDTSAKRQQARLAARQPDNSPTKKPVSTPDIDALQAGRKAKQQQAEQKLLTFIDQNGDFLHEDAAAFAGRSRSWVTGKVGEFESAGIIEKNGHGYIVRGGHYDKA